MLHAHDRHQFVVAQQPEITGLEEANMFEYHPMGKLQSLPSGTHLLNAKYGHTIINTNPMGKFPNTRVTSASMVLNNNMALTTGIPMPQSFNGVPYALCSFCQPSWD